MVSLSDVQVVIPAAGSGLRFANEGYKDPKPFIKANNTQLIDLVAQNLPIQISRIIGVFSPSMREYKCENKRIISTYEDSQDSGRGMALTAFPVCTDYRWVDKDRPLLVMSCDQFINPVAMKYFLTEALKDRVSSTLTFINDDPTDLKWSFAKVHQFDDMLYSNMVTEVVEKPDKFVSKFANVSAYLFHTAQLFINCVRNDLSEKRAFRGKEMYGNDACKECFDWL